MNHIERLEDLRDQLRTARFNNDDEAITVIEAAIDRELDAWNTTRMEPQK
jgi:hypothetical protein